MSNIDTETDRWPTLDGDTLVGAPPPPAAPPPPGGPPPDRRIGAGMVLGLAAVLLAAAGIAIAYFLVHRDSNGGGRVTTVVVRSKAPAAPSAKVTMPHVLGMAEQQAVVRLARLGLKPKVTTKAASGRQGVVLSQKPQEATQLTKGATVTVVVSSGGPQQVAVPDLTGKRLADAQAALGKLGLRSTSTEVTGGGAAGTVVDQAPKAGAKLAKGSVITLSVVAKQGGTTTSPATQSTPSATQSTPATTQSTPTTTAAAAPPPQRTSATVPDVTTQQEAAAVQALNQAGILASVVFIPGTDPLGTVEQQAKQAGTTVPYHAHLQINLSTGPGDKPKEQVPSVVGQSLQQAVASLNAANLRLIYVKVPVTSRASAGKVVQQSPLAGGSAPQNAQVVVFLGAYRSG